MYYFVSLFKCPCNICQTILSYSTSSLSSIFQLFDERTVIKYDTYSICHNEFWSIARYTYDSQTIALLIAGLKKECQTHL